MTPKKKASRKTGRKTTTTRTPSPKKPGKAPAKKPAKGAAAAPASRAKKAAPAGGRKATAKATSSKSPSKKAAGEGGVGRPPFRPTDEQRAHVETLAGLGLKREEIVLLVTNPATGRPIDEKTLSKHFAAELARGGPKANAKIAQSLFRKATGDGSQSVTAAIWWTKCRMGWKERVSVEVEAKAGVLVAPGAVATEEWIRQAQERGADAAEPGSEDAA